MADENATVELAPWEELVAGRGCPLCFPRPKFTEFVYFVRQLETCSLYLSREQTYRGAAAVVYDLRHVVRIDQLSVSEWTAFAAELQIVQSAIYRAFAPDHINVESLGNTVPHLHFHVIPRYKTDERWRGPIWMTHRQDMPKKVLDERAYAELAKAINGEIEYVA